MIMGVALFVTLGVLVVMVKNEHCYPCTQCTCKLSMHEMRMCSWGSKQLHNYWSTRYLYKAVYSLQGMECRFLII